MCFQSSKATCFVHQKLLPKQLGAKARSGAGALRIWFGKNMEVLVPKPRVSWFTWTTWNYLNVLETRGVSSFLHNSTTSKNPIQSPCHRMSKGLSFITSETQIYQRLHISHSQLRWARIFRETKIKRQRNTQKKNPANGECSKDWWSVMIWWIELWDMLMDLNYVIINIHQTELSSKYIDLKHTALASPNCWSNHWCKSDKSSDTQWPSHDSGVVVSTHLKKNNLYL